VGDVLPGKVVRMTDFGLFVELRDGVEGLVHVSELADDRVDKPSDRFKVGDEVVVKIVKLNPEEKKIGLSIREAMNDDVRREVREVSSRSGGTGSATLGDFLPEELRGRGPASGSEGGGTDEGA
jgi:small subunit ribosomal protein S1